jgi:hypothetical protein
MSSWLTNSQKFLMKMPSGSHFWAKIRILGNQRKIKKQCKISFAGATTIQLLFGQLYPLHLGAIWG